MSEAQRQARLLPILIKIADHINSQYTRGKDGRLYPTFNTPRRDDSVISDYRASYLVITRDVTTSQEARK